MFSTKAIRKQRKKEQAMAQKTAAQLAQDTEQFTFTNSDAQRVRMTRAQWGSMRLTAARYGWAAAGTNPPPELDGGGGKLPKWYGEYDLGTGEWISADDAAALAQALEIALGDGLPDPRERARFEAMIDLLQAPGISITKQEAKL